MAQLVGGILGAVQPGSGQVLLHQLVDRRCRDAPAVLQGDKQGILVHQSHGVPLVEPVCQRPLTGVVQIQHPLLVALTKHPKLIAPNICFIQPNQLGDTQAAVEEQGQNAVIPLLETSVHALQQIQALVQGQILGQRLLELRGVQILDGIVLQQMGFSGQVVEKRPQCGNFSGPGGRALEAVSPSGRCWAAGPGRG